MVSKHFKINQSEEQMLVGLLFKPPSRSISIGLHGELGIGKSSILEMIQKELNNSAIK